MIKDILIPGKLGSYYIFPKRVVGFDIDKTNVKATKFYLNGNVVTIERFVDEKLEIGADLTHDEKVSNAIRKIIGRIGKFDEICSAVSSSQVIFKSLRLPFVSHSKIKMVINYEVEPLLPFSLNDAIVDFIIVDSNLEENSSEVMVAAVKKEIVDQHISLFEAVGVTSSVVGVDVLSLYSLYKRIPIYSDLKGDVALIDVGFSDTRVLYVHNGRLAFVRTLPKGIFSQAKDLSRVFSIDQGQAIDELIRFGLFKVDDGKYNEAMSELASKFWDDIRFTLRSFAGKLDGQNIISKVLLLGQGARLNGVVDFVNKFFNTPSELLEIDSLIDNKTVKIKNSLSIPSENIISLSIGFPSEVVEKFNLNRVGTSISEEKLINKQLVVLFLLIIFSVTLLLVHSFIQISKLSTEVSNSQKEVISVVREKFNIPPEEETLEDVVAAANEQVRQNEEIVFAFSRKARTSFLKYLLAIHDALDKKALGLDIEQMTISSVEGHIILKAQVKNYEALKKLEKELRKSKLFSYVEPQEKTDFIMKIIVSKNI